MKPGEFIRDFFLNDDRKVNLRYLDWSDIDDYHSLINSLIEEEAPIGQKETRTREQTVDRIAERIKEIEKGRTIVVVAEIEGRMIGFIMVRSRVGRLSHVGELGVMVRSGYRGKGIGAQLIQEAEIQSPKIGVEILILEVFANNPAIRLYKRMGYSQTGIIPRGIKYKGEYVDCIHMTKELTRNIKEELGRGYDSPL